MTVVKVAGADLDIVESGSGRDLVLLHSLLTDRSAFDPVVPELSKTRRLTLVNLPGYGASTPTGAAVEDYADRIAALISVLDLPHATDVLGNGFGGFISIALAARHGARFDRLIVADALATFPEPAKQPLRNLAAKVVQEGMAGALDIAIRRMFPESFIAANPHIVEERRRVLAKEADAKCFQRACLALARLDFTPILGKIRNPTLVIVGALDQTTPPALARELANGIPGAQFLEIPGCGHCPQIEKPQAIIDAVSAFLAR
ncbi:MAG: alpha/beta fold hydrolase [Thermodesulfobacteriota bacterium]